VARIRLSWKWIVPLRLKAKACNFNPYKIDSLLNNSLYLLAVFSSFKYIMKYFGNKYSLFTVNKTAE
jgi:hypothetical protein